MPTTTNLLVSARFALGLVFLMSALPKARDPGLFARHVVDYKVIPASLAIVVGWALVPAEIFLAVSF
ncbi:MAG: MauE/DoxX family redox-associated membrane protein, partial [Candidatus Methylomirabilaceae bacterium]